MGVAEERWSILVPELIVRDRRRSLRFYCEVVGFRERFARPENGFSFIEMGEAQIMLEEMRSNPADAWLTGELTPPFGRGMNLQIEVPDVGAIHDRVVAEGHPLFRPLGTSWYRQGDRESGQSEFLVQDPDGYLLRFIQHLGERPSP